MAASETENLMIEPIMLPDGFAVCGFGWQNTWCVDDSAWN